MKTFAWSGGTLSEVLTVGHRAKLWSIHPGSRKLEEYKKSMTVL